MGLIKKIFGDHTVNAKATEIDRAPRITLSALQNMVFRDETAQWNLGNISVTGMGVLHDGKPSWKIFDVVKGLLVIDRDKFDVQIRVRHLTGILAGCEFVGANSTLQRAIENYLRVEIVALSLYPVREIFLKVDPRGQVEWLTDGRQNEFYCVHDDNGVVAYNMSFFGNYIEGGRGMTPRSGHLVEGKNDEPAHGGHKPSTLLDVSAGIDPSVGRLGEVFVRNIAGLTAQIRNQVCADLKPA